MLTDVQIDEAVARFSAERDRFQKLESFVRGACEQLVADDAILATIQSRTKDLDSFQGKLQRKGERFNAPEDVFGPNGFDDFAGVRIATYVERDRERVVKALEGRFDGPADGHVKVEVRDGEFYRATHCTVQLAQADLDLGGDDLANLIATPCEVQVCSMLAHVWNEIDHDRAYKPTLGELNDQEIGGLNSLGHLTRAGDSVVEMILAAGENRIAQTQGSFVDSWDFVTRARPLFPEAADFGTYSGQLFEALKAEGIDSPDKIEELMGEDGIPRAAALIGHLQAHLDAINDPVVGRIDPQSSDPLLMLLLDRNAEGVVARLPAGRGRGRPARIRSVAQRFIDAGPIP